MTTEDKVELVWKFYCFRRHLPGEVIGMLSFIDQHKELGLAFSRIVSSAGEGMCAAKCMACGKNIFGDQALGGLVVLESGKLPEGQYVQVMAPVCATCAKGDIDILESRCLKYFAATYAGGEVKVDL